MNSSTGYHRDSEHQAGESGPRFKKLLYSAGNSRRFGTYFASRSSVLESIASQESETSSWELVTDDSPPEMTEAQKLVMMYRIQSNASEDSDSTLVNSTLRCSDPDLLAVQGSTPEILKEGSPGKQYTPIVGSGELRANWDAERQLSLLAVFQEAMDTANRYNKHPGDKSPVICPRFGCGNSLANVNALIYHLHIHDIDANLVVCKGCKQTYEHGSDTHFCPPKAHRRSQWTLKLPSCSAQSRAQIKHFMSSLLFAS